MSKTFTAAVAVVVLAAGGAALAAELYPSTKSPALPGADVLEARYPIVCGVIDERLSLLEAAVAFRDLNRRSPVPAEGLLEKYPGDTEGDRLCEQVLAFVRVELDRRLEAPAAHEPSETHADPAVVLARLRKELAAAQDQDGKVYLPEGAR